MIRVFIQASCGQSYVSVCALVRAVLPMKFKPQPTVEEPELVERSA